MPQFKYEEITKKIIGAAMKVHSVLGNGFQEVIYQRGLEIEMRKSVHFAQARNYFEAYNLEIGLLINFGNISLEYKRLENPKYNPNPVSQKSILIHPNPRSDK